MPAWKGSIPDSDIWAISHFVSDLYEKKDTPAMRAMMKKYESAPPWTPPAWTPEPSSP